MRTKEIDWQSFTSFGDIAREIRVWVLEEGLRTFLKKTGFDAREWSCVERNLKQVSQEETDKLFDHIIEETGDNYFEASDVGKKLRELSLIQIVEKRYNTDEEVLHDMPLFCQLDTIKHTEEELRVLFKNLKTNW